MPAADADPARPKASFKAWWSLAVMIFLYVVSFTDRQVIALLVDPIKRDMHLSDAEIGMLQGFAFVITYCFAGLPIGWAVDRYPRRWIIGIGVFCWSLAAMATGFARTFWQFFAVRAGVGIGEATLGPAAFSLISDLFPRERLATALSFYTCGSNLGSGLAFAVGGLVVASLTASPIASLPVFGDIPSWKAVFIVVGAPGLLFAFAALLLTEAPRHSTANGTAGVSFGDFLRTMNRRRGVLIPHFIAFPLCGLCAYVIAGWVPTWCARNFGWGMARIGPLMGLTFGIIAVGTTLAGGFLTDRLYRRGLAGAHFVVPAVTCTIGAAICIVGLVGGFTPWLAFWTVAIGATIQSAFGGAAFSSLQLVMPAQMRGRTSALYIFILSLVGYGFGQSLVGWLTDNVFGRPQDVGKSLAVTLAGATSIALVALVSGRRALAAALLDADDIVRSDALAASPIAGPAASLDMAEGVRA